MSLDTAITPVSEAETSVLPSELRDPNIPLEDTSEKVFPQSVDT